MRRLHPVFNIVKLTLAPPDPIVGQRRTAPPPPELIDGEEEYAVKEILDSRMFWRRLQYLVKWEGYGIENNTWEYVENLDNAAQVVADFHLTHPGAPRCICAMVFGTIPFRPVSPTFALSRHSSRRGGDCKGNTLTLHMPSPMLRTLSLTNTLHH